MTRGKPPATCRHFDPATEADRAGATEPANRDGGWHGCVDHPRDAIYHDASTYLVLATMLPVGLVAAAIDLARLVRRTLASARTGHAAPNDKHRRLE
ncbi:hypothetical protein [Burkholderia sp. JKS000303]|uniref:hypothetical protein n=1 Tax=Burkholderia sp. JKS000303 TaxID=1938747 RepID=UPI00117DD35E|nr:hypothetical protein [Burkholderia sp. JKS000303]